MKELKLDRDLPAMIHVSDKFGERVRLRPNRVQRDLLETLAFRDIINKARQHGVTTLIAGRNVLRTAWHPNMRYVQVVETEQKARRNKKIVEGWLEGMQAIGACPTIGTNAATTITFPKIHSRIDFYWAGGEAPGRGDTITFLHLTEMAHYEGDQRKMLAALKPSVPPPPYGEIVIESTPNGAAGFFYEMYKAAKDGLDQDDGLTYKPHFYEWWWADEYRRPDLVTSGFARTLTHEERELMARVGLDLEQVAWRRWQMRESELEGGLFLQEYPEDDEKCFFSHGSQVFGPDAVPFLREKQSAPLEFPAEWLDGDGKDPFRGALKVWKKPQLGSRYVIGADVAEGTGRPGQDADYSAACVIDFRDMEHVATLRSNRIRPADFAVMLDRLGKLYHTKGTPAYLAVERRHVGVVVCDLLRDELGYRNLYSEKTSASGELWEVGFMTSLKSRPNMINDFHMLIHSGGFVTHDRELIEEIGNFIYDDKGHLSNDNVPVRANHRSGAHDDLLFAAMIAVQARATAPLAHADRPKPKRLVRW